MNTNTNNALLEASGRLEAAHEYCLEKYGPDNVLVLDILASLTAVRAALAATSKPEPTPSQHMKEAGFTRRPGLDSYNEEVYGSEPATQQASTPEVVAYMVERPVDVGVGMDQEVILSWDHGLEDEPSEPLITLKSHLDAVAKDKAALKVDMETIRLGVVESIYASADIPSSDAAVAAIGIFNAAFAAITQAKEAQG